MHCWLLLKEEILSLRKQNPDSSHGLNRFGLYPALTNRPDDKHSDNNNSDDEGKNEFILKL